MLVLDLKCQRISGSFGLSIPDLLNLVLWKFSLLTSGFLVIKQRNKSILHPAGSRRENERPACRLASSLCSNTNTFFFVFLASVVWARVTEFESLKHASTQSHTHKRTTLHRRQLTLRCTLMCFPLPRVLAVHSFSSLSPGSAVTSWNRTSQQVLHSNPPLSHSQLYIHRTNTDSGVFATVRLTCRHIFSPLWPGCCCAGASYYAHIPACNEVFGFI